MHLHSLCRVLGGLWPLTGGRIYKPGGGGEGDEGGLSNVIFYVPQRPYVTQGSLQEQLIYPLTATEERRIPEDQLRVLLGAVDLQYLLDRQVVEHGCVGGWVCCFGSGACVVVEACVWMHWGCGCHPVLVLGAMAMPDCCLAACRSAQPLPCPAPPRPAPPRPALLGLPAGTAAPRVL